MKKFTFLLSCLITTFGAINAQDRQTSNIEVLLDRLKNVENPIAAEPTDLFSQEERLILQEHFRTTSVQNPSESLLDSELYVYQIHGQCNNRGLGTLPLESPYNIDFISYNNTKFYAGDFDGSGNLYGVSSDMMDENGFLIKIDPTNGVETMIGNLNLDTPHVITGLAWNPINEKMYALSSNSDFNRLYTVDLETAELTSVGGALASRLGIWLAISPEGIGYTVDIGTSSLYSINLETGVATIVGSIGVQLSNAQDGGFDRSTGILYAGGYHGGGAGRLYSVDTSTGLFTNLGTLNNGCAELGIVAFKEESLNVAQNSLEGFSFYPNPTSDVINLTSVHTVENVSIYNLLGQQLMKTNLNQKESKLDVSSLQEGTYILKVTINGKIGHSKFIKN